MKIRSLKLIAGWTVVVILGALAGGTSPWSLSEWQFWVISCPLAMLIGYFGGYLTVKWAYE